MSKTNTTKKMQVLIGNSIRIYSGMKMYFPQFDNYEIVTSSSLSNMLKFSGCYATNNSTAAYVIEQEVYVIPITDFVMKAFKEAGLVKNVFWVPFSNLEYPVKEKKEWEYFLKNSRDIRKREFVEQCCAYCDQNNIRVLEDEVLENTLKIPQKGIETKHLRYNSIVYPIIKSNLLDDISTNSIGHYQSNNGVVVFVYRDGNTYVTKGYKIITKLEEAGYKRGMLYVPFSNCEEILDQIYAEQWKSVKKF